MGTLQVPNHDGKRHFLTLLDDKYRYTWVFLMHTKSDAFVVLKEFLYMVKTWFGVSVMCFRTDNGTDFFNYQVTNMFKEFGVLHQSSCVYYPQQNGVVERKHRSILDMTRAMIFQASVPLRFWGCCVSIAVYTLNMLLTMVLKGKSHFEVLFGKSASLQHLKVFDSLFYATTLKHLDKFAPSVIPAVHLGSPSSQKGYVLYDLSSK